MKNSPVVANSCRTSLTRRAYIDILGILGAGLATMASPPQDATATVPVLTIADPTQFKILQVTDLHLFEKGLKLRRERLAAIAAIVDRFKPDIIVNTGDFWSSRSDKDKADTCQRACREFAKLKTPWAFAWGNHDEAVDYNRVHECLGKTPFLLYCGAADGNYRVEVQAKGSRTPLWNLIMLNSGRDGFKAEQIDWFKAESQRIKKATSAAPPAFLFFHIPLPQYDDVAASEKVIGAKLEKVCQEKGSRDAFSAFRDAGFVKATFCGHDHTKDYYGISEGVRLQYGRSGGGYGDEHLRKGATLITVDIPKRTFETQTVFADGSSATFDKSSEERKAPHK